MGEEEKARQAEEWGTSSRIGRAARSGPWKVGRASAGREARAQAVGTARPRPSPLAWTGGGTRQYLLITPSFVMSAFTVFFERLRVGLRCLIVILAEECFFELIREQELAVLSIFNWV